MRKCMEKGSQIDMAIYKEFCRPNKHKQGAVSLRFFIGQDIQKAILLTTTQAVKSIAFLIIGAHHCAICILRILSETAPLLFDSGGLYHGVVSPILMISVRSIICIHPASGHWGIS